MTCCVSTLADEGRTIILVSDRMVGTAAIAGEPDIRKAIQVHERWWVQFSGTVPIAVAVIAAIKQALKGTDPGTALDVAIEVRKAVAERWAEDSEAAQLIPHGWTNDTFRRESNGKLPDELIREIDQQRSWHEMDLSLLVSGFDKDGDGHIFSISGSGPSKFICFHHDVPGYWSIGTGSAGALYMMNYKDTSYKMTTREALYYALEGKFFGELGANVGWDTDVYILRPGEETQELDEAAKRAVIDKVFPLLKPHELKQSSKAVKFMNEIPSLAAFSIVKSYADEEKEAKAKKPG